MNRRNFLHGSAWLGLGSALGGSLYADEIPGASASLGHFHHKPTAKRVIHLFMGGGPPQLDLFDYKPNLKAMYDKDLPESVRGTAMPTGMTAGQSRFPIAPSKWDFIRQGQSGQWISSLLPEIGKHADEMTIIRSMNTDAINHEPASLQLCTGNMLPGKPSLGAWLSYGLGSMNPQLPAFVVLNTQNTVGNFQNISPRMWGSAYLSSSHAGVNLRTGADPVLYLKDPDGLSPAGRKAMLDSVAELNRLTHADIHDPEILARTSQYDMARRLQDSMPELADLSKEPQSTWDLYGDDAKKPGTFAYNCLMARRMAERNVRYIQINKRGWDVHENCGGLLPILSKEIDRPMASLLTDLRQRGLLDDTLVLWAGEFGRTVYSQGGLSKENYGRDHHAKCFSVWMAGGGVKGGLGYGQSDDFSYAIADKPVHVRDLGATMLHALGIDHQKLTYRYQGLDQRFTGVLPSKVIKDILA